MQKQQKDNNKNAQLNKKGEARKYRHRERIEIRVENRSDKVEQRFTTAQQRVGLPLITLRAQLADHRLS